MCLTRIECMGENREQSRAGGEMCIPHAYTFTLCPPSPLYLVILGDGLRTRRPEHMRWILFANSQDPSPGIRPNQPQVLGMSMTLVPNCGESLTVDGDVMGDGNSIGAVVSRGGEATTGWERSTDWEELTGCEVPVELTGWEELTGYEVPVELTGWEELTGYEVPVELACWEELTSWEVAWEAPERRLLYPFPIDFEFDWETDSG